MKIIKLWRGLVGKKIDFFLPGEEILFPVFERLKRSAPLASRQVDPSFVLIQTDFVMSELMPLAVAVIVLKKASASPGYLYTSDFERLCECAADAIATIHAEANSVVAKLIPQLPGLVITAAYGKDEASKLSAEKISSALSVISRARVLLPADQALLNLSNCISEKLKINRLEAESLYESI